MDKVTTTIVNEDREIDRIRNIENVLVKEMRAELEENLIPFWIGLQDPKGGYYSEVDQFGRVDVDASKGALLNSRILWFFSRCTNFYKGSPISEQCRAAANHAYIFMRDKLLDKTNGGLYWSVDNKGLPLDTQKHIYNHAFAVYALSEWYVASQDTLALSLSKEIVDLIEHNARDTKYLGYFESFDEHWNLISNDLLCDTEPVVSVKSMNTHLHILEAYSRFYDISPSADIKSALNDLLAVLLERAQNTRHSFHQFFKRDWTVESKNNSYGHDIEGAWLIWEAARKVAHPAALDVIKARVLKMTDSVALHGLDFDGGLLNEWVDGKFIDTTKVWWVQAEAIVGFANAWQLSGDPRYLSYAERLWRVVSNSFIDKVHGEWMWQTNRWGESDLAKGKVSAWKCPYHNGRACLEIISRLESRG